MILGDSARDVDTMKTACQFCHQCLYLREMNEMRSGVLIWLPELGQGDLHHVAREIYLARITHHSGARARKALEALMARREAARERLGTDDPNILCERLASSEEAGADVLSEDLRAGIRLLPLDRRIMRVDDLEFNQFPQVLAFWRSSEGPYNGEREFGWITTLNLALEPKDAASAGSAALEVESSDTEPEAAPTHASLAVGLLRDAAVYFRNIGDQNPKLSDQMNDNAKVYAQVADLLDRDPAGELSGAPDPTFQDTKLASIAARLLEDSATFFEALGRQNEPLKEQMDDNASVYRDVAHRVRTDPLARLDFGD